MRFRFLFCFVALSSITANAELVITEIMPRNAKGQGLEDEDGDQPDWIEIHNPGRRAITLSEFALTDDFEDPLKWPLPDRSLKPGRFLVVFASGKDRYPADGKPHANFKLEGKGEFLALTRVKDKEVMQSFDPSFPEVGKGQSCGYRFGSGGIQMGSVVTFLKPSPGRPNSGRLAQSAVADTKFSVDRGFYEEPIRVRLSTKTPGATIRYTVDGSVPSEKRGLVYSKPLIVSTTTVLRAKAFKKGLIPTNVDTATYVFPEKVAHQPARPKGWPTQYDQGGSLSPFERLFGSRRRSGMTIDYEMTPPARINATDAEMVAALKAIPSLSLVTDRSNFLDARKGIFLNPQQRGRDSERPVSVELIDPSGREEGFQIDAGIRIRGGHSRSVRCHKHSFRLYFRKEYGAGELEYPLFGDEGVDRFDDVDLRTAQNYSYHYNDDPTQNTFVREVFSRDCQAALGQPYTRSRYYHLYINGLYWGLYQTQEHAEASYAARYFGGEEEDYDVVKSKTGATDGNSDGWRHLWEKSGEIAASQSDAERLRIYNELQGLDANGAPSPELPVYLDVENLIDYMLVVYFTGNYDGPISNFFGNQGSNNWFSIWKRNGREGFKFFCHDSEHTLGAMPHFATINRLGPFPAGSSFRESNPQWIHQQLTAVGKYRESFRRRAEETLLGDGPLSLEANLIRLRHRAQEVRKAVLAECARWGDTRHQPCITKEQWEAAVQRVEQVLALRATLVPEQLSQAQRYAGAGPFGGTVPAPLFNAVPSPKFRRSSGGEGTFSADRGEVFYTLDGTDPKGQDGEPHPAASKARATRVSQNALLPGGAPVHVFVPRDGKLGTTWTRPGFDDSRWTKGAGGVGYDLRGDYRSLIQLDLSGQMHNRRTSAYARYRFTVTDSLSFDRLLFRIKFEDGFVAYLNGQMVASMNVPRRPVWNGQAAKHDDSRAVQWTDFDITRRKSLLKSGVNVLAVHVMNDDLDSSDLLLVPELLAEKDVKGTIVKADSQARLSARTLLEGQWSPLFQLNQPGASVAGKSSKPAAAGDVVISEIMYHPGAPTAAEEAEGFEKRSDFEFLELSNVSDQTIDLSGVYCREGVHFIVAEPVQLAPKSSMVLARNPEAFRLRYSGRIPSGAYLGNLSNKGERLTIRDANGDVLASLEYDDEAPWPTQADGDGSSLVLKDSRPAERAGEPSSWKASERSGGSPGTP